jgi:protein-S-isoprenylcysteine O-methyltransferase Ste14
VTDVGLISGTALLTHNWGVVVIALAYMGQLGMQLGFEERELKSRFGEAYLRYCHQVPRFVPRLRPVDPGGLWEEHESPFDPDPPP